ETLSHCAITPENRALLDQAADPSRYRPDPDWLKALASLYVRFGDRTKAAVLLQQAQAKPAEAQEILGRAAPLTAGVVTGRIEVNGRPGASLAVGLLPARE